MITANFDSGKARNTSKALTNASKAFKLSADAAGSLDIPDFPYAGYLFGLPGLLNEYDKKCELDIEWINSAINKVEEFNKESISEIEKVEVQSDFAKNLFVK